ncbi:hypothetical protein J2S75_003384 [Ancylobacter polymorphus]|uniref:DUF4365 domain-containing protein n=3 Tax=Ancylobacter polymorphus TaxID=223390 RepID=A0ABU0BES6_9HYPH|nr:hypothetical protein [Ancylobacter polymorphus]MDQ0304340.1 hypothetical protein [Ancylobacter polymorphus]
MTRLPAYAERFFAAKVSEFDGLCHRVDEDEGGWDYVVELPHRDYDGPADSQPPRQRAFVQVKSIEGLKTSVPITLSNLRKSAQDPSPWFVVLIKKRHGEPVLYIKHFWTDLIARSLKMIRAADVNGVKINKRSMSISFTEGDIISGDFIKWMQECIDTQGDYIIEKRRLYTEIGHEKGYGTAKLLFAEHTNDEIFKEFLGIGNGLKISSFEYVPERFSVPDYSRKVSETGGTVYITPQPQGTCDVRFRSSLTDAAFHMTGMMYAMPFAPEAPIRVSAPPVEILFSPQQVAMNMVMRFNEPAPLDHWHTYSRLKLWSMKGPLRVELWLGSRKIDSSIIIDRQTGQNLDWEKLYSLAEAIRTIANDRNIRDLSFSLADINAHITDLGYLSEGCAPLVRFQCDATTPLAPGVTSFLHYSLSELAGWTFGHLIRRTVLQDVIDGGKRIITAGPFDILETYAFKDAGPEERALVKDDYERVLRDLEKREHPLGFGDFGTYIREMQFLSNEPNEST